ncbi:hypothetical protein MSSD14B_20420 [Marinobacter salsuginis]|uniref:Uncharacterized protein n=1 Tax=Marinobacter salsuginis TaxID=418719 RepID=A0A5M3PZL6_9GAMM|nr:hypothetical protein MSSD14B_20420 [Marinobacter salsuginis]
MSLYANVRLLLANETPGKASKTTMNVRQSAADNLSKHCFFAKVTSEDICASYQGSM